MEEKTIIDGIKLEVDLRTAKRVDQFRVGDAVKVLVKEYQSYKSYPGMIAGFDAFKERPTIIVAYLETGYSPSLKFVHINKESADIEIAQCHDADLSVNESDIVSKFDTEIEKKKIEIKEIETKKEYFVNNFRKHFSI